MDSKIKHTVRVLLVDDDEEEYILTRSMLSDRSYQSADVEETGFEVGWVSNYDQAMQAIEAEQYDVYLVDYRLGERDGLELLREALRRGCTSPIIMMTGQGNYELDLESMRSGAADYLQKSELTPALLERTIRYAVERKRAEDDLLHAYEDLDAERAKLSAIIANVPGAIVVVDGDGQVVLTNPQADHLIQQALSSGGTYGEMMLGASNGEHDDRIERNSLNQTAADGEPLVNLEQRVIFENGGLRYLLVNAAPILDHKGKSNGAVGIYQDITQRKIDEEEMRRRATRIEVQQRLIQHREMDRVRIARDLHDGPLQELIGINFAITGAIQGLEDQRVLHDIHDTQDALRKQIRDLRIFCSELRPPTLMPFGLEKAIMSHVDSLQARYPELAIHMDLMPDGQQLPEVVRLALFRIYQELISNVIRHAQATEVHISFKIDPETLYLEVADNGQGFELNKLWVEMAREGRFGLVSAIERAEAIKASVQIETRPGAGTRVHVSAPRQDHS